MKKQNTIFFALLMCNSLLQAHKEPNHYATIAPVHLSSHQTDAVKTEKTEPESKTLFERMTNVKPPTYSIKPKNQDFSKAKQAAS